MPDADSITIDEKNKSARISLNPTLYPQSAVMRAAYRFTDGFDVVVDGDALSKIVVTLKAKPEDKAAATKADIEKLANAFFSELIHANVEELQARRYADTRNALIGAALRNLSLAAPDAIAKLNEALAAKTMPEKSKNSKNPENKGCI